MYTLTYYLLNKPGVIKMFSSSDPLTVKFIRRIPSVLNRDFKRYTIKAFNPNQSSLSLEEGGANKLPIMSTEGTLSYTFWCPDTTFLFFNYVTCQGLLVITDVHIWARRRTSVSHNKIRSKLP